MKHISIETDELDTLDLLNPDWKLQVTLGHFTSVMDHHNFERGVKCLRSSRSHTQYALISPYCCIFYAIHQKTAELFRNLCKQQYWGVRTESNKLQETYGIMGSAIWMLGSQE